MTKCNWQRDSAEFAPLIQLVAGQGKSLSFSAASPSEAWSFRTRFYGWLSALRESADPEAQSLAQLSNMVALQVVRGGAVVKLVPRSQTSLAGIAKGLLQSAQAETTSSAATESAATFLQKLGETK